MFICTVCSSKITPLVEISSELLRPASVNAFCMCVCICMCVYVCMYNMNANRDWHILALFFAMIRVNVIFALITSVPHCFVSRICLNSFSQLFASNVIFALRRFRIDSLFAVRRLIRRYSHLISH
jgi:hypothetical protein